jgi:hypothetical protein
MSGLVSRLLFFWNEYLGDEWVVAGTITNSMSSIKLPDVAILTYAQLKINKIDQISVWANIGCEKSDDPKNVHLIIEMDNIPEYPSPESAAQLGHIRTFITSVFDSHFTRRGGDLFKSSSYHNPVTEDDDGASPKVSVWHYCNHEEGENDQFEQYKSIVEKICINSTYNP